MTEQLRNNPDDLNALVAATADALGMPMAYLEKDFWVTEVLRAASAAQTIILPDKSIAPVTFTFKGGTSLSRVFRIIERFSEDVDLLAEFPAESSVNARHKILKAVDKAVKTHLGLASHQVRVSSSTTGVKRYTEYSYRVDSPSADLKDGVLLELGSRGGSQPSTVHEYRSLVADHAIKVLGEDVSVWEEFAPFEVNVLAPERTLFEKLAAVHDAASRNDIDRLMKHGRHFYDIYCLLENAQVLERLAAIESSEKDRLIEDIEQESVAASLPSTKRPDDGYAVSPAFQSARPSWNAIETGYNAAQQLIYGSLIPLEDVVASVNRMKHLL